MEPKKTSYPKEKVRILFLENISDTAVRNFRQNGYTKVEKITKALTEAELIDQTAKQVYELSVILRSRYKRLQYSCWYLEIAMMLFFIFLVVTYVRVIISGGF